MESETHYKRVGIFVLSGIFLLIISIAWLSHNLVENEQKKYLIFFEKQTLDGLQKDSPVTMKGIKIGTVADYKISDENIQKVKVLINVEADVPIKTDSRAVIKRNLLTGIAKVDIIGGTQNSKLISKENEELPVIPEEVTQLEKIADSASAVVEQIENSLSRINLILSDKNIINIENSFSSISNVSAELDKMIPQFSKIAENFSDISTTTNNFSKKHFDESSENSFITRSSRIIDNLEQITSNLKKMSEETTPTIRSSSRSIQGIEEDLAEISKSIKTFTDSYSNPNLLLHSKESNK
jgi:phospholipid/cholesterol/gamma-HCH transport system substrate-binding protein